jgi:site-specific DNA-methyltransferase (adenine-specific)
VKKKPAPSVYAETPETFNPLEGVVQDPAALVPLRCAYRDDTRGIWLYHGDCLEMLDAIAARHPDGCFDMIFADPPYFLSNGGITCHAGQMVKVDKGNWDKSRGPELNHEFNTAWLRRCQKVLKPHGTIWVTGTHHVIFSVGYAMQQLGYKILNDIAWEKPNPPPNLSCRYFTHSTETVIWAAKGEKSKHCFNYQLMRQTAGGKQMKTVWRLAPPSNGEKVFGKHPTQKPVALVERCILASTHAGGLVLDPFMGGGTTAVAAIRLGRRAMGLELELSFIALTVRRLGDEIAILLDREIRVFCSITVSSQKDLDLRSPAINRSRAMANEAPLHGEPIFHECKFVFLSCARSDDARVVCTTIQASLDDAWGAAPEEAKRATTHIVRCETEILRVKDA